MTIYKSLFSFFLINTILSLGAVENINIKDERIFTPDTNEVKTLEPTDKGFNNSDFEPTNTNSSKQLSVGLISNIQRRATYGAETDFEIIPIIEGQYKNFSVKPITLDSIPGYIGTYNFYNNRRFKTYATSEYEFSSLDASKLVYPYNKFIESKNSELYFGLSGKYYPESDSDMNIGIDISKNFMESKGTKLKIYTERISQVTKDLEIVGGLSLTFLDKNYVNYFYGVPKNSYSVDSYQDASGFKGGIHLDLKYRITDNTYFRSINSIEFLSSELAMSPIINNNVNFNIGFGIQVTF